MQLANCAYRKQKRGEVPFIAFDDRLTTARARRGTVGRPPLLAAQVATPPGTTPCPLPAWRVPTFVDGWTRWEMNGMPYILRAVRANGCQMVHRRRRCDAETIESRGDIGSDLYWEK